MVRSVGEAVVAARYHADDARRPRVRERGDACVRGVAARRGVEALGGAEAHVDRADVVGRLIRDHEVDRRDLRRGARARPLEHVQPEDLRVAGHAHDDAGDVRAVEARRRVVPHAVVGREVPRHDDLASGHPRSRTAAERRPPVVDSGVEHRNRRTRTRVTRGGGLRLVDQREAPRQVERVDPVGADTDDGRVGLEPRELLPGPDTDELDGHRPVVLQDPEPGHARVQAGLERTIAGLRSPKQRSRAPVRLGAGARQRGRAVERDQHVGVAIALELPVDERVHGRGWGVRRRKGRRHPRTRPWWPRGSGGPAERRRDECRGHQGNGNHTQGTMSGSNP